MSSERALSLPLVFRTFSAPFNLFDLTRGDAPRFARRLPLAIIVRAFGAANTEFPVGAARTERVYGVPTRYREVVLTVSNFELAIGDYVFDDAD